MTVKQRLSFYASVLLANGLQPEQRVELAEYLQVVGHEHEELSLFRDQIVLNGQEEADEAERQQAAREAAIQVGHAIPFARRALPIRLVPPSIVAVEWTGESVQ